MGTFLMLYAPSRSGGALLLSDCGRDSADPVGGGEVERVGGPAVGVSFAATPPKVIEAVCNITNQRHKAVWRRGRNLTLADALPKAVLVHLAQASHSAGVAPSDKIRLLELVHERLFASVDGGATGRASRLEGATRCKISRMGVAIDCGRQRRRPCRGADRVRVVDKAYRPVPTVDVSKRYSAEHGRASSAAPLEQGALFAFEPPLLVAQALRGILVEDDVHEEAADLGDDQREVAHARRLHEVAFEPAGPSLRGSSFGSTRTSRGTVPSQVSRRKSAVL